MRLHDTGLYDQGLLELKKLVNERNSASINKRKIYDIAINKTIDDIYEISESIIPSKIVKRDIELALEGGKYRELYIQHDSDDVIQIRKKKTTKTKPKRIIKKKITKKRK